MIDPARSHLLFWRTVFVAMTVANMFVKLLPLGREAGNWPGPDLFLCLIFVWVLRRPAQVPVLMLAVLLLAEDMLLMRPPGLWTALVLVGTEFLRVRAALTRELSFLMEWLLVSAIMLGILLAYRAILFATMVEQVGFGFALVQILWTVLCYPLVVGFTQAAFNLRRPGKGEVDMFGRRL